MRPLAVLFLSASVSCCTLSAQYQSEPFIFEHYDTTLHFHADGTGDRILHITARLQSDGAVRQFTVISVPYDSSYGTGSIDYIRVHKPDGTTIETPVADAIEMPAPVTRIAPLYSDLKEKQVPVRSLAAGDVIEYQLRTTNTSAEKPGQFWGAEHFVTNAGVILSQTLTLEIPADKYVQVWDPNHPATPRVHDGVRTYTWTTAQLKPTGQPKEAQPADTVKDPDEDAEGRKLPSVAWTTFPNWAEVGAWYRTLALARSQPTPSLIARANELTKDAKTPEDQIRALYSYVSTQIRYVGIDFGIGRLQPHAADEVMTYQYGDCKDKSTLLEALLRAKGFTTAPALIGVGITPVPEVPSPALFNHVITLVDLPSGRIWLDTTPEVAPYRVLIPLIRDQLALVVPATGPAGLERTPADPPFPYFERFEAIATLDKDGLLKGHMDWTLRSDNELVFRALLQQAAPAQWNSAMQNVSQAVGFQGTVSNADLKQKDSAGPVHISYDYTRPSYADWDHHRILPLFPALELAIIDKDKAPDHDIALGAPRTLEAITRIQLPAGFTPNLPSLVHVDRSYATYDQTYRVDKDQLIIERKVVIRKNKVPKADWKDYYSFTRDIGAEREEPYIALTSPGHENGEQTVVATAASEALTKAGAEIDRGQWEVAQQTLNQVKATAPDTPYLMSMLGSLAQRNGNSDEAIRDYEAEVTHHPDAPTRIVTQLANLYLAQKRYQDEEALLRKYTDRNDDYIYSMLVNAQIRSGDDAGALTTLQGIMATHPNDRGIDGMLAGLLHKAHRDPEAIAIARTWLAANDAKTINSGAYLLSEMNLELPLAEVNSRRAIRMMEADSARVTLHDTNDMSFFDTDVLAFAWNTLGWVLYQEGKPAEAEPYLRAAWFSRTDMAVANKLAQVLEAQNKKADALAMNQVALLATDATGDIDNAAAVRRNIERLHQAGVTTTLGDPHQALEAIHTFSIANTGALEGSAAFKISIVGDHIEQAILVEGPAGFESLIPQLSKVTLPGAVPPDSKARLFRGGDLYCASTTSPCELRLIPRVNPAAARPYVKPKESVAAN